MRERAFPAWCIGGGGGAITWESVIEWNELERETGGGNSSGLLGCFGGGVGVPTGSASTCDVDPTPFPENQPGSPGIFGGTGGGRLWIRGVECTSNGGAT